MAQLLYVGEALTTVAINRLGRTMFAGRELLGRPFVEALEGTLAEDFVTVLAQVLRDGVPQLRRAKPIRGGEVGDAEKPRVYNVYVTPYLDADGKRVGVSATYLDLTATYADYAQAQAAHEAARNAFTGGLTHDLRGPLTAVRLSLERLAKAASLPAERQRCARALQALARADLLVENLLDVSRVRAGHPLVDHRDSVDAVPALLQVVQECRASYGRPIDFVHDPTVVGHFDATLLGRATHNLVHNAVSHGEPGGSIGVTLRQLETGPWVELAVHNRGNIDAADAQARLLQPFARGEQQAASAGWGLGLSVVQAVAKVHEGTLTVLSEAGATRIVLRLALHLGAPPPPPVPAR